MPSDEKIICDPKEFIPSRVELSLNELGLDVIEAEWGDSEHELFLIKQERGEIPGDRHPPNRTVTIKLRARKVGAVKLAEALKRLQMKVGRWQDEGGFVKRIPDSTGGFSSPVAFVVYTASLGGLHGWLMAHRAVANEITLTLTVGPYCYGVKELESAEFKAEEVRQLEYELANVQGTAPGLFRLRVKNEGATNWLTSINAMQSRDHSAAATALLSYEAEALTLLGLAKKATRTGGSGAGENVVRSGSLTNSWQAVLLSKISATGEHMTHVGTRRIICRIWDPNATAGNIRLELQWRVLGATQWISNEEQRTYVIGNFSFIDFGEVRPEKAVLGNQRWEFRVIAKTESTVGQEVQLDQFHILPTEQFAIVEEELETLAGGQSIWEDGFEQVGNITGKTAPVGGTYEVGALAGTDFTAGSNTLTRKVKGTGRIVLASASSSTNCLLEGTLIVPSDEGVRGFLYSGFVLRYVNSTNYLKVGVTRGHSGIVGHPQKEDVRISVIKVVAGVETTIYATTGFFALFTSKWKININAEGKIFVEITEEGGGTPFTFNITDAVLKTGEALAAGKMGIVDILEAGATVEPTRTWDEIKAFGAIAGEEENKQGTCYAGRSMEFRSDGVYRQHASAEIWTRLTPDGFLPYAPPSGLEARPLKGIFMPSVGNLTAQPDSEKYKLSAKIFYFPGYHFASEAS